MENIIKVLVLKPFGQYEVIERFNDTLDNIYKTINCECIDIIKRRIGDKPFDIIVDDEFLLKNLPQTPTALYYGKTRFEEQLFGTIIICGLGDFEGNLTSLTDNDIGLILDNIQEFICYDGIFSALIYSL